MTKKKIKNPKVGDKVFKKGASKFCEWTYQNNVIIEGEKLAYITTCVPKMKDGQLVTDTCLIDFVRKDSLTLEPPAQPTQFYMY